MCLSVCLEGLLRQKEACQPCGLETTAIANRPTLCTVLGPTQMCYIFKAPQRKKMIWHRRQENRAGAGRDGINKVFYLILD